MNSKTTNILNEFHKSLITFFDELIEQCPDESAFVMYRILLKDQIPIVEIMSHFVQNIYPDKDLIINKDERFILEKNSLFPNIDKSNVNYMRKIWRSPNFDKENKETTWNWLLCFIKYVEKYKKSIEVIN